MNVLAEKEKQSDSCLGMQQSTANKAGTQTQQVVLTRYNNTYATCLPETLILA
jgi:hypothetical protein